MSIVTIKNINTKVLSNQIKSKDEGLRTASGFATWSFMQEELEAFEEALKSFDTLSKRSPKEEVPVKPAIKPKSKWVPVVTPPKRHPA